MADPKHPRHFTDEFKRQIVELVNAGKPKADVMREYDLSKSTVDRWVKSINATGSPHAADNRTPEQNRVIELERENRRLRMEVDVLKQAALSRDGITASRRRICRIMRKNGLTSACGRRRFKCHPGRPNEADLPNVVAREFGGHAPRTHVCSDLTYVRVGGGWNYVCLLVDLSNREIVGHSAGPRKDAALVRAAFATLEFPISDIEVFHTDRGSEFDNAKIDEMLDVFGIERSLSRKGCPYDNAVDESTNKILKAELVYREMFGTTRELQVKLADYVHWYNNFRMHSTLGYMTPVEFRKAGLVLPKSSKKM